MIHHQDAAGLVTPWTATVAFVATFLMLVLTQKSVQHNMNDTKDSKERTFNETSRTAAASLKQETFVPIHHKERNSKERILSKEPWTSVSSPKQEPMVPSHRIAQLFPGIDHDEVCTLLFEAGVQQPNKPMQSLDQHTQAAIQLVVDILVSIHYPDDSTEEPTIECPCCYEDYSFEQMVSCKNHGHLFCTSCVQRYAEEVVFGSGSLSTHGGDPATELMCFAEGCSSSFPQSHLERALTTKVLERYGELQGSVNLAKANLKNLCTCPKCGFKAELYEDETTFRSPNPDCQHSSCRHCGEPGHAPLTCSQVKKKENSRLRTEEAMTAALIRRCPNPICRKELVKNGGCNKLKCSCGWLMCNVCKKTITGYKHFCQAFNCKHETCGKCALWKETTVEDNKAIEEALRKGQEEARRVETGEEGAGQREAHPVRDKPVGTKAQRKKRRGHYRLFSFRRREPRR